LISDLNTARVLIAFTNSGINNITTDYTIDVNYIDNYFNNWSIAVFNIQVLMDIGLGEDVSTDINDLYTAIEPK
jgi:hypothetical protein